MHEVRNGATYWGYGGSVVANVVAEVVAEVEWQGGTSSPGYY
jgi:hypothetical protein